LLLALAFLPLKAGVHKGVLAQEPEPDGYDYYFPIMYRDAKISPDLVVSAITVNYDSAVVVIKNQGAGPVESTSPFWIDLYVDPDPLPGGPNDVWDQSSAQGIVWGLSKDDLPLEAGETVTMTYCPEQEESDPYYWADYSRFEGPLAPGTMIAVQVDSANAGTDYGGVLEVHEIFGTTYNNIRTALSIVGSGCGTVQPARSAGLLPLAQPDGLPPRRYNSE
jgi:hypothetical protein